MHQKLFRTTIVVMILSGFIAVPSPGKDEILKSTWASARPKIDGMADDWAGTDFARWNKGEIDYAFRNDADNLYVLVIFKNPKTLSTAGETGLRLYFNAAGKKDKDYGVHFIRRQVPVEEAIAFVEKERTLSEEEKAQLRTKPAYNIYDHQVYNKKAKSQPAPPGTTARPAHFRFASQPPAVTYEFEVPLGRDDELAAGVGAAPGETVMVGFEWGWPTDAQLKKAARTSGEAGIANEDVSEGRIERMATARGGSLPPRYVLWSLVRLAKSAD